MAPPMHLLVASALGMGVYAATGSAVAGAATVVSGVLPDADHLLDYYNWFVRGRVRRLFYLLHGWEYLAAFLVLAAALGWPPVLVGITVGYASHIVGDYLVNARGILVYSLAYRVGHRFRMQSLQHNHGNEPDTVAQEGYGQVTMTDVLRWAVRRSLRVRRVTDKSTADRGCQCGFCVARARGIVDG